MSRSIDEVFEINYYDINIKKLACNIIDLRFEAEVWPDKILILNLLSETKSFISLIKEDEFYSKVLQELFKESNESIFSNTDFDKLLDYIRYLRDILTDTSRNFEEDKMKFITRFDDFFVSFLYAISTI